MDSGAELERRMQRLERVQRRLAALVALLGCAWLLSLAWQLAPRPHLVAGEFLVRDGEGPPRASLGLRSDHAPLLRLNDRAGRARLYAIVEPSGQPSVRLTDSLGVHRLILEQDDASRPYVELFGPEGGLRAIVSVDTTGYPWGEFRWHGLQRRFAIPPGDTLTPARP